MSDRVRAEASLEDLRMIAARRAAASAAVLIALVAPAARAQTQEQLDRIRSWNPKVGEIQKPGEIQVPKGTIQTPGEIQVPRGIQAVRVIEAERCERRLSVGADALFEFDQWTLSPQAEETLVVVLATPTTTR
jgi:outer membrane protein OmpA-like peptidoglycan-associated protein